MPVPSVLPAYKAQKTSRVGRDNTSLSMFCTFILFFPILLFFFLGGIFIGSTIVDYHTDASTELESPPHFANNILLPGQLRGGQSHSPIKVKNVDEVAIPKTSHTTIDESSTTALSDKDAVVIESIISSEKVASTSSDKMATDREEWTTEKLDRSLSSSYYADYIGGFELPKSMDAPDVAFGVWIYLDSVNHDSNMRTVFSNKAPGCESSPDRNGIAVFVNEWMTSDHKLYAEFGNEKSGCNKVSSADVKLENRKWYHVAVTFVGSAVTLYLDGEVVGRSSGEHSVQQNRPITLGQYSNVNSEYPLLGNMSHFAVAYPSDESTADISVKTMKDLQKTNDYADMVERGTIKHLFTLQSSSNKGANHHAIIGNLVAKLKVQPLAISVKGVKMKLIDGIERGREVTDEMRRESDNLARSRREHVKSAMKSVWTAYKSHAWGMDELKPRSKVGSNNWGGLGVTLVDSLDTLWVMGLKTEFEEAAEWVKNSLTFSRTGTVSVFETTIRELGGLISAYDFSKNKVFLEKAIDLGDRLIKSFGGGDIPQSQVDLASGLPRGGWSGGSAILSELGTLQVEFRYLSMASGDPKYEKISMKAIQAMYRANPAHGLYPIKVGVGSGKFTDQHVTFGALGDSFYEYLLKLWIQGGKKETWLRDMYDRSVEGMIDVLLKPSSPSGLAYISDWDGRRNIAKMDHLVCFMPGVMALGAYTDPQGLESARAQRDLSVAKALMYTCREMYHRTETGISPEFVNFPAGKDIDTRTSAPFYILRPETAESLFVLNQLTGDPIYRDWAYEIWSAIDKHCRNGVAYGALRNVNVKGSGTDDRMESFFLAETLKYLYLVQDPDNEIDILHKYVFNTEAHPTRIFDDGIFSQNHIPISKS